MLLWFNRPHTTVKNERNLKSVSQVKPPYFEGFFKLWKHEQQELPFLQMFIRFVHQNLTIFFVTRISFFLEILMLYEVYCIWQKNIQIFNVRAARATLNSNVHQVYSPKSKNFCVKRPWNGFFYSWKFWCCMMSIDTTSKFPGNTKSVSRPCHAKNC